MVEQNQAKWLSHRGQPQQWQWPVSPPNGGQGASPGRRVEEEAWISGPGQPSVTRKDLREKGKPHAMQTEFAALIVKDQCYGSCLPTHRLVQSGWFVFQNFLHRIGPIFGISTWGGGVGEP